MVSLPRETFLPHTSQKTVLLLAKKRERRGASAGERVLFAVSERAGKDAAGDPIARDRAQADAVTWRGIDHDLGAIEPAAIDFLRAEGFAR